MNSRLTVKEILQNKKLISSNIEINAWVKTFRSNRFISLNDGSTIENLQAVIEFDNYDDELIKNITTGSCVKITGQLIESQGKGQEVELLVVNIEILGKADTNEFPLQPKNHSLEFLREIGHLRFRTNTFGAIFRVRHALAFATHKYFNDLGFFYINTPIITKSDAEGAGEMFRVSTLDAKNPPIDDNNNVNFKEDFFGGETNLTVSGQLEAELAAMALGKVYTFGPTFRAENSNTSRHLAEFWMIEPEVAFNNLNDNQNLAESYLKYLINYVLENCIKDLEFLNQREITEEKTLPNDQKNEMNLLDRLKFVVLNDFERITYTEAIDILKSSNHYKKKKFKYLPEWGSDLQSEHERYLVEKHYKKPVIIRDYPASFKAFYMRQNDDNKTVAAMDILFPGIGEIVGGSQREERIDVLRLKMKEFDISEEDLWWYVDTRKFGACKHSGFGLGFERMVMYVTGMKNIRDVIPFARTPKNAEF